MMRRLWLTLFLLLFSASPCLVLSGCGPSASDVKEAVEDEENEDQFTDDEAGDLPEDVPGAEE
jgi:hypothetical protein